MTSPVILAPAHSRVARLITAAPDRLLLLLFWTCLVVSVTVTVGIFRPWTVVPLVLALTILTWRFSPAELPATRTNVATSAAVLLGAAGWVVLNIPYVARYVVTTRDPGFLTLGGVWLTTHPGPDIPVGPAMAVADQLDGVFPHTGAYARVGDVLQVQGADLVPGLLAVGGWVGGVEGVLAANLVLGAGAVVGVFALARRLAGSRWALVPAVAFATCLPLLAFARGAYTEPVVAALLLGGLVLLWSAFSTRRRSDFVLAGAMVGAGALARIDGLAMVIGLAAGSGLVIGAALAPTIRRRLRTHYLWMIVAALLVAGLGIADLMLHSRDYLEDLRPQIMALGAATTAAVGAGLVLTTRWPWSRVRAGLLRHRKMWAWVAAGLVAATGVVLASRPLWLVERHLVPDSAYGAVVGALQSAAGVAVDPGRSYDEQSVTWLSWYLGAPTVVLALGGLAWMVGAAIRRRDPRLLAVAAVIGAPTLLYLVRISITPDQIWAMRRLLPVTIPGLLVVATWAIAELWTTTRQLTRHPAVLGRSARVAVLALAGLVALTPPTTWSPVVRTADFAGQLGQLRAVCSSLADAGASRVVYVNGGMPYLASLVTVCGVEVVEVRETPTPAMLTAIRAAWGDEELAVVAMNSEHVPWRHGPAVPVANGPISLWEQTIVRRPRVASSWQQSIWVGMVQGDGTVTPLP